MQISTWKHMDNCKNQTWCSEHYRIMAPILVLFKTSKAKYNSTGWFKKKKKKTATKSKDRTGPNSAGGLLCKQGDLSVDLHAAFTLESRQGVARPVPGTSALYRVEAGAWQG